MAASSHAILRKKLEEVEAQVADILQSPIQLPHHIYRIRSKVHFIKNLLTAENGSSARDSPDVLQEMTNRLSVVETKFVEWASSENGLNSQGRDESTLEEEIAERLSFIENNLTEGTDEGIVEEGGVPPTLCEYCLNNDEVDESEDQDNEQVREGGGGEENTCSSLGVSDEEKVGIELEAMMERIVGEVTEKAMKERRRGSWLTRTVTVAAAAAAAVGLVIAGLGSVDESAYLVPT